LATRSRKERRIIMTSLPFQTPPTHTGTIAEHEAQQVERANATKKQPIVLCPRTLAAAQQLGSLGRALQRGRIRTTHRVVAG
ncbi:MAG: hypothetical protein ACYTXY_52260, partial [Nostoc sp.]